jgi:hypothetical protein
MTEAGAAKIDAEAREIILAEAMEFLRQADQIRRQSTCREVHDGSLVVIEQRLIAIIEDRGAVVAGLPSPQRYQDSGNL